MQEQHDWILARMWGVIFGQRVRRKAGKWDEDSTASSPAEDYEGMNRSHRRDERRGWLRRYFRSRPNVRRSGRLSEQGYTGRQSPGGFWLEQQENKGLRRRPRTMALLWNVKNPWDIQGKWPAGRRDRSWHIQLGIDNSGKLVKAQEVVQAERAEWKEGPEQYLQD